MIDRQNGGVIFVECDSCDAVLDTDTKDFDEARDAAAWLRNLIAAGLIAPGDVDERSTRARSRSSSPPPAKRSEISS